MVITADNSAAAVIGAVPVASATSTTALSTAAAPLTLTTSTMGSAVSMTPPSTTEAAYVAAKQTVGTGPAVTIKYQGADLASGAYTIANLPVAAPQYVAYSAARPLVPAPVPGVSGGSYRVEAAATGYAASGVDAVSIATQNQTPVNFTLTP